MKCEYCNNEVQPGTANCPACGAPAPAGNVTAASASAPASAPVYAAPAQPSVVVVNATPQAPAQPMFVYPNPPKSRVAYIILALFFGALGVHNFYAKRTGCGIAQLLISVLSFGFLAVVSWLWCIVEMVSVDKDGNGVPFK